MHKIKSILISSLLTLFAATYLSAQSVDPKRDIRDQKAGELDQRGNFERAAATAQKAIEVAEASVGPDHPYVAINLNNLAVLYREKGDYARAVPLYKRSLAIWEKALGPDHPYVADCLNNLSELYRAMGKDAEALEIDNRLERIREVKR